MGRFSEPPLPEPRIAVHACLVRLVWALILEKRVGCVIRGRRTRGVSSDGFQVQRPV